MRFYLVLANMTSECVPIRTFTNKAEAMRFAKRLRKVPSNVQDVWPWDCNYEPHNNLVVKFVDGVPVATKMVEILDDAEEAHGSSKGATRVVFRVLFNTKPPEEYASFEEAVRAVRVVYPGVDFGDWEEYPPAGNGDRCSATPFGKQGVPLGSLLHLRLVS
jgi:hypothetical protein